MNRWTANGLGDNWGAETSPSGFELQYAQEADRIAPGILDYAMTIITSGESILNAINRARISVTMTDLQREQLDQQLQRARTGLPPTTLSPTNMQIQTQTILMIAAALVGLYLLTRKG